jgi:hypothetical protein
VFEKGYKNAKVVVSKIKEEFKTDVKVDLIIRNVKNNKYQYYFDRNVEDIKSIDKRGDSL